jgi:hypothetical protein
MTPQLRRVWDVWIAFARRSENLQKRYRDKATRPPFRGLIWDDGF